MRAALSAWAEQAAADHSELLAVGLFGSYARGDWGVGSDADVVLVVEHAPRPFVERARDWDVTALPVPADLLVYDAGEWDTLAGQDRRFARVIRREVQWLWRRPPAECSSGPSARA